MGRAKSYIKDYLQKIENNVEITNEEYSRLHWTELQQMTSEQIAKLNPNKLYLIPDTTYRIADEKTIRQLKELGKQATYHYTVNKEVKLGKEKKIISYEYYPNQEKTNSAYIWKISKKIKNKGNPDEGQQFYKETGIISRQDLGKLLKIQDKGLRRLEEDGIIKPVLKNKTHIYYDYIDFIETMNDRFIRAERDSISPKRFEEIVPLLTTKEIQEQYGESSGIKLQDALYQNPITNKYRVLTMYMSYFDFGKSIKRYPSGLVERVIPVVRYSKNKTKELFSNELTSEQLKEMDKIFQKN